MFTVFFIATALLGNGNEVRFHLDSEIQYIDFMPNDSGAPISHATVRNETSSDGKSNRTIWDRDGTKTITQTAKDRIHVETIRPDGSKDIQDLDAKTYVKGVTDNFAKMGISMDQFDKVPPVKKLNEFKTIVGVRCQKTIIRAKAGDQEMEVVAYVPIDPKLNKLIGNMEGYTYVIDGDNRQLYSAQTVVGFKLPKS